MAATAAVRTPAAASTRAVGSMAAGSKQAPVSVVVRLKPVPAGCIGLAGSTAAWGSKECMRVDEKGMTLEVFNRRRGEQGSVNNVAETHTFAVNGVITPSASQSSIFDAYVRDACDCVCEGISACVLAYGQTGAGKTYTLAGPPAEYGSRGMVPRAIAYMMSAYERMRAAGGAEPLVRIQYLELYNERLFDLLSATAPAEAAAAAEEDAPPAATPAAGGRAAGEQLTLHEDVRGRVHVRGLTSPVVRSEADALNWWFAGESNRAVAEHALNKSSTRSHCIFTMILEQTLPGVRGSGPPQTVVSKLFLVDLAGSERLLSTQSEGQVMKEATFINKSLTFLEQVVIALTSPDRDHVPFRSSKLTHILKDALSGRARTRMIACVWPEAAFTDETVSTLRFATRMMCVKTTPGRETLASSMSESERARLVSMYERECAILRTELAMRDALAQSSARPRYTPVSTQELEVMREGVESFILNPGVSDIHASSAREYMAGLHLMRDIIRSVLGIKTVPRTDTDASDAVADVPLETGLVPPLVSASAHTDAASATASDVHVSAPASRTLARLSLVAQASVGAALHTLSREAARVHTRDATARTRSLDPVTEHAPAPRSASEAPRATDADAQLPGYAEAQSYMQRRGKRPDPNAEAERAEELLWWRSQGGGATTYAEYTQARASVRDRKSAAQALTLRVNDAKRLIDACVLEIHALTQKRAQADAAAAAAAAAASAAAHRTPSRVGDVSPHGRSSLGRESSVHRERVRTSLQSETHGHSPASPSHVHVVDDASALNAAVPTANASISFSVPGITLTASLTSSGDGDAEAAAAVKLQASVRGHLTRKQLRATDGRLAEQVRDAEVAPAQEPVAAVPALPVPAAPAAPDVETEAAIRLQASVRGHLVRKQIRAAAEDDPEAIARAVLDDVLARVAQGDDGTSEMVKQVLDDVLARVCTAQEEQETAAAVHIQARVRGHLARKATRTHNDDAGAPPAPAPVADVPALPAVLAASNTDDEEAAAAVKLQASVRGHLTRKQLRAHDAKQSVPEAVKDVAELKESDPPASASGPTPEPDTTADETAAATRLQASIRGHLTRKQLRAQDGKHADQEAPSAAATAAPAPLPTEFPAPVTSTAQDDEQAAAVRLQASVRGHLVRKQLHTQNARSASPAAAPPSPPAAVPPPVDDETASVIARLRELKSQYRSAFDDLNHVKGEIEYLSRVCDGLAHTLAQLFNDYWTRICSHSDVAVAKRAAAARTLRAAAVGPPASAPSTSRPGATSSASTVDEETISRAAYEGAVIRAQAAGMTSKRAGTIRLPSGGSDDAAFGASARTNARALPPIAGAMSPGGTNGAASRGRGTGGSVSLGSSTSSSFRA